MKESGIKEFLILRRLACAIRDGFCKHSWPLLSFTFFVLLFGPGDLRPPTVVADGSEAGLELSHTPPDPASNFVHLFITSN